MTPASIRMVVSSYDTAIMFMPNSPRPPSGVTSSVAGDTSGTEDWFILTQSSLPRIRTLAGRGSRLRAAGRAQTRLDQRLRGKTIAQLGPAARFPAGSGFRGAWMGQVLLVQRLVRRSG